MNPRFQVSLILILGMLASSCVHTRSNRLQEILTSWHGHDPDQLVQTWGAPESTYTLREGGLVLTYQHTRLTSRMSFYRYPENYSDSLSCKANFYTDEQKKVIRNSNFQGDASTCLEIAIAAPQPAATPNKSKAAE